MIKVGAFTGGRSVPSARFRVRQYIQALTAHDIAVEELPCHLGKYPPRSKLARPFWLAGALCEQAANLRKLHRYDLVLLQREIISKLITFERWVHKPVLMDVDDAIFLFRNGYIARRLAEIADVVICGNSYLADHFSRWNRAVRVIPTAVDTDKYRPAETRDAVDALVVGWIGTSSNLFELHAVEASLATVLSHFPRARLRIVCDRFPDLPRLNSEQVERVRWTESCEVAAIQSMDVGIMPLSDSVASRGKCSFKMLQYMACGLPSVVSAVGMNVEVARLGKCSLTVRDAGEWTDALIGLLGDAEQRRSMGLIAREVIERRFSVHALASRLADAIRDTL